MRDVDSLADTRRDAAEERIVLLDDDGVAIGTADKAASHHNRTPLHLAFSCFLVNEAGEVLVTRRATHKATWPDAVAGSCCGHPAPGERLRDAVRRRVAFELGVAVERLTLVLPAFGYRATMPSGIVEHERCPVVRGLARGIVAPNPDEVGWADWRDWASCRELAAAPAAAPWFRQQIAELAALGEPRRWPEAPARLLPPAVAW